jgi:hypothetical protein
MGAIAVALLLGIFFAQANGLINAKWSTVLMGVLTISCTLAGYLEGHCRSRRNGSGMVKREWWRELRRYWMTAKFAATIALSLTVSCTGVRQQDVSAQPQKEECLLSMSYERGTALSCRVWDYLQIKQFYFLDAGDRSFRMASWRSPGEGRADFEYQVECDEARRRLEIIFEEFADEAPDAQVAHALREANTSWRKIDRVEYERVDFWRAPAKRDRIWLEFSALNCPGFAGGSISWEDGAMSKQQKRPSYSPEVRERAVRMVGEQARDYPGAPKFASAARARSCNSRCRPIARLA